MKNSNRFIQVITLSALVISSYSFGHGDVVPHAVNTDGLEPLKEKLMENPYSGNDRAIEIGASGYLQNCARCHGLEAVSGGITPDLRKLNDPFDWENKAESDEWYINRVRNGAVVDGRVYMPPFEGILNQEAMWSIKAYIETLTYEE